MQTETENERERCVCGEPAELDGWCRWCIADGMRRENDEQRADAETSAR